MRVLLTGTGYASSDLERLRELGHEVLLRERLEKVELWSLLPALDAYVLGGDERLDAEALSRAECLRVISFVGSGYGDFIDVAAAGRRGIRIANTPAVAAPAVVEHTLGLLLGLVRGLFAHNAAVKQAGATPGPTAELGSLNVGIVGLGEIGSRVARALRVGFGSKVSYFSRTRKPALEQELSLNYLDLESLFETSDAVVLLTPMTPETVGMVGADLLARARPGLLLVNTAGARLVDPSALRAALSSGRVAAAAFDSYWIEPPPPPEQDSFGFLSMPDARFVVTPHVAAKTFGTWTRMMAQAVDNIIEKPLGSN